MNKIDDMIGKALTEEDRALLASHGEPGYLAQAFGIFRGPMAGIMWMVNVASGVAALALFQVTSLCKTFMANRMEANRLLRELKRVELQVAMLRDKPGLAG
jgi:hypothetical protein